MSYPTNGDPFAAASEETREVIRTAEPTARERVERAELARASAVADAEALSLQFRVAQCTVTTAEAEVVHARAAWQATQVRMAECDYTRAKMVNAAPPSDKYAYDVLELELASIRDEDEATRLRLKLDRVNVEIAEATLTYAQAQLDLVTRCHAVAERVVENRIRRLNLEKNEALNPPSTQQYLGWSGITGN